MIVSKPIVKYSLSKRDARKEFRGYKAYDARLSAVTIASQSQRFGYVYVPVLNLASEAQYKVTIRASCISGDGKLWTNFFINKDLDFEQKVFHLQNEVQTYNLTLSTGKYGNARCMLRFWTTPGLHPVRVLLQFVSIERVLDLPEALASSEVKTTIAILTNNHTNVVKQCIEAICSNTSVPYHLLIADNGSTEQQLWSYLSSIKSAQVIMFNRNCGVAAGRNKMFPYIKTPNVVFIDSDQIVQPGWLKALEQTSGNIVGNIPRIVDADGNTFDSQTNYNYIGGGGMLIRQDVYRVLQFDEQFSMYGYEDVDYCIVAQQMGFTINWAKNCQIEHKEHVTAEAATEYDWGTKLRQNQARFVSKHHMSKTTHSNIQSLWIGSDLSQMERLSINSFLKQGHEFHLYTYGDVGNIPKKTVVRDANEILSKDKIFVYQQGVGAGSYSAFSNLFRYKLLYERGGTWVDLDTVCLQPFDFDSEYVFSSEMHEGKPTVNAGLIRAPAKSLFLKHCWQEAEQKSKKSLSWGTIGPKLVAEAVKKFGLDRYVCPPKTFCPIPFANALDILDETKQYNFTNDVYAVHLWNEIMRRQGVNKDQIFPSGCLYQKLLERYNSITILVTSTQRPYWGGAATNAYALIKFLRAQGYKTAGLFFTKDKEYDPDSIGGIFSIVATESLPHRVKYKLVYDKLINFLGQVPDLILAKNYAAPYMSKELFPQSIVVYLVSGSATLTHLAEGSKLVSAIDFIANPINAIKNSREINSLEMCDFVVPNSELSGKVLQSVYGKLKHIRPPTDTSLILNSGFNIKPELSWKDRKYDIAFICSNLQRKIKNAQFALKLFNYDQLTKLSKIVVGGNNQDFKNLNNCTTFNILTNDKVIGVLQNSKVVICPSLFDSSPNLVREAILCGCNVVVSQNCGWSELYGKTSVCSDVASLEEWTQKILNSLNYSREYPKVIEQFKNANEMIVKLVQGATSDV